MLYAQDKKKENKMRNYKKTNINNTKRVDNISNQLFEVIIKTTKIEESQKYIKEELLKINKHLHKPSNYSSVFLGVATGFGVIIIEEIFKLIF